MLEAGWIATLVLALGMCGQAPPARENTSTGGQPRLHFRAIPEKHEYRPGQVIRFTFSLRNLGKKDILVARHFVLNQYVWLKVTGPDGNVVPWCGKIDGRLEEFAVLRPGARIESQVRVSCDSHKDSGFVFDLPGTYEVSAEYYIPEPVRALRRIAGNATPVTEHIPAKTVAITVTSAER